MLSGGALTSAWIKNGKCPPFSLLGLLVLVRAEILDVYHGKVSFGHVGEDEPQVESVRRGGLATYHVSVTCAPIGLGAEAHINILRAGV